MPSMSNDTTQPIALTHDSAQEDLMRHHDNIATAVHQVLESAGLQGFALHSVRIAPPPGLGSPCNPPCPQGKRCVLDSNGGEVKWICV